MPTKYNIIENFLERFALHINQTQEKKKTFFGEKLATEIYYGKRWIIGRIRLI